MGNTLRLWDLAAGKEECVLYGHTGSVYAVELTPDCRYVVSTSEDQTLRVWDIKSRKEVLTFTLEENADVCVVVQDSRTILAAGYWGRVHILQLIEPNKSMLHDDPAFGTADEAKQGEHRANDRQFRHETARIYMNRSLSTAQEYYLGGVDDEVIADLDRAAVLLGQLMSELPSGSRNFELLNDLAASYMNRGIVKARAGTQGAIAALADYDRAITLWDSERGNINCQSFSGLEFYYGLARAYAIRGSAKLYVNSQEPAAVLSDYDEAINLLEVVHAAPEHEYLCDAKFYAEVARAYATRANAKLYVETEGPVAAMADYDRAIAVWEDLAARGTGGLDIRDELAKLYVNRSMANGAGVSADSAEAIADYDRLMGGFAGGCCRSGRLDSRSLL